MNQSFQKNINKSAVSLPKSQPLTLRNKKENGRYQHIDNNITCLPTPKGGADLNGSTFQEYQTQIKQFKQFRSRSRKGKSTQQEQPDNQKLLAQIIKGHEMGRNHIILKPSKTTTPREAAISQKEINYRIQYGSDEKDDYQENLDEDDEEPKKSPDTLYNKIKPEVQQIPCLQPNLKNRKDINIYSFSKNIDYKNITQQQISKFLHEKTGSHSPSKKRVGSKKKSLQMKNAEKENLQKMDYIKIDNVQKAERLGQKSDPRNRKSDLYLWNKKSISRKISPNNNNAVQVLDMNKSQNSHSINQSNSNMNENFSLKLSKVQDHSLKKKFSQSNFSSYSRQKSSSPTKNGASTERASLSIKNSNYNTSVYNNASVRISRPSSKSKHDKDNQTTIKMLSQQYSNTTARAENFKMAVSKKTISRNLDSMNKSIKSPLTTQKSIYSTNEQRKSQVSSNYVLQSESPEYQSSKKRISNSSMKLSQDKLISACKGSSMSRNQNVLPTHNSRDKHMAHTVQINLADNLIEHDLKKKQSAEVKKENSPFVVANQIISSSGQSSCQEEKLTQQGSGNQSTENHLEEVRKTTKSNMTKSDNSKDDQLTYEKHQIWRQSQIMDNSLDVTEKRSFKASMKGLNMMTFVEKCPDYDVKINDNEPIKCQSPIRRKSGSTVQESDNMIPGERLSSIVSEEFQRVSMDAYKALALNGKQSSSHGPRRLSRMKRGSNVSYNEFTESRKTANFTSYSMTYNDDDDIDEFSIGARERDAEDKKQTKFLGSHQQFNFDGIIKIDDANLTSAVTMGDCEKAIGQTQHTRSSILSPAFAVKDFESTVISKLGSDSTIAQKNDIKIPKQQSKQYDICNSTPKKNKPIYQEIVDLSFNSSIQSVVDYKIDFESLYQQQDLLLNMKEIIEIRSTAIQTYKLRNSQDFSMDSKQAIEGLFIEERQKIKQLCQDWWDSTQEDVSLHKAGQIYYEQVQLDVTRGQIDITEGLSVGEKDFLILHHEQRSICMRKCAVIQTSVIGMIAFFSMLSREGQNESSIKQDLELRQRLSQLLKMIYDQSMLCLSFIIGKLSQYENVTKDRTSNEHKLYQIYNDYIHILFINKKIQTENDYQIYNQKNGKKLFPQRPDSAYITNEENRDYQLNQLSQRLQENSLKIINTEMEIQKSSQKYGNLNLLRILKDVSKNAGKMDFQTAKNKIYEGISQSDVMPSQNMTTEETLEDFSPINDKSQIEQNPVNYDTEQNSYEGNSVFDQENIAPAIAMKSQIASQYGAHLVKTFKDDSDQIIHEESREESMSVSQMNSSKIREDYMSNSKHGSGLFNSYKKNYRNRNYKFTPSKESDKVFEMNELDDSDIRKRKNTVSSINGSVNSNSWSKDINAQVEEHEKLNPETIRVQCLSQIEKVPREPYLPTIKPTYKYTVVLDLDETLVHCTQPFDKTEKDFQVGNEQELIVYKRPGLHEFLLEISKYFEVVVFTAGGQAYAKKIVSQCLELSKDSNLIDHILFWDHVSIISDKQAFKLQQRLSLFYSSLDESYVLSSNNRKYSQQKKVEVEDVNSFPERTKSDLKLSEFTMSKDSQDSTEEDKCYVKDLSKLGRDLSKMIIVDNLPENYALQLNNGICIREYRVDNILDEQKIKEPDRALNQLSLMLRDIYKDAEKLETSGVNVDLRDILQKKLKDYRGQRENYYFV